MRVLETLREISMFVRAVGRPGFSAHPIVPPSFRRWASAEAFRNKIDRHLMRVGTVLHEHMLRSLCTRLGWSDVCAATRQEAGTLPRPQHRDFSAFSTEDIVEYLLDTAVTWCCCDGI
jgi:hypothetical protein